MSVEAKAAELRAAEPPLTPPDAASHTLPAKPGHMDGWDGPTYYGRPQLKSAPFNNWVVGGYVALAGMCGSAALISAVADLVRAAGMLRSRSGSVARDLPPDAPGEDD